MAEEPTSPPEGAVRTAVEQSRAAEGERGRVAKVLYLNEQGDSVGEWASTQLPENPFTGQMQGLQEPPFRLEQLVYLAESHPVHSAALDQKTADICGKGWEWEALDEDNADESARDELEDWFQGLAPDDEDMHEIISASWLDVETIGWGGFEVARDPSGIAKRVYHVPMHTVRAHRDGYRLCQIRDSRKVWFRRWGAKDEDGNPIEVDAKTGSLKTVRDPANDLFIIKRKARRSSWYGIPGYISAVGWITLALAARDDNLFFFANRREPRWAIILTNLADDDDLEDDLRRAFTVDLRQPYRNILVPITGPGEVHFEKLSDKPLDGSFENLSARADKAITIAHRVPAERIANAEVGSLGGNIASEANRVYKEGVVAPSQELLNSRLNRFIAIENAIAQGQKSTAKARSIRVLKSLYRKVVRKDGEQTDEIGWALKMDDLDIRSDREDLAQAVIAFHGDLITLQEARTRIGLGPLKQKPPKPQQTTDPLTGLPAHDVETGDPIMEEEDPDLELDENGDIESELNDKLFTELPGASGQGGAVGASPAGVGSLKAPGAVEASREAALAVLTNDVRSLLRSSREINDRLSAADA